MLSSCECGSEACLPMGLGEGRLHVAEVGVGEDEHRVQGAEPPEAVVAEQRAGLHDGGLDVLRVADGRGNLHRQQSPADKRVAEASQNTKSYKPSQ